MASPRSTSVGDWAWPERWIGEVCLRPEYGASSYRTVLPTARWKFGGDENRRVPRVERWRRFSAAEVVQDLWIDIYLAAPAPDVL